MSKTPRGSSSSQGPQVNRWQQHVIERAAWIKDRDANPVEHHTVFGTWRSGKDGTGGIDPATRSGPPPVRVESKRKYRPGN